MALRTGDHVYISPLVHPTGSALEAELPPESEREPAPSAFSAMLEDVRRAVGRAVPIARYDLMRLADRTPRG
jgi:hypothetical protein